jgi:hypothetical protein
MNRRLAILTGAAAVLLAGAALWAYGEMSSRRAQASAAQADLADCGRMAQRIRDLRDRPARAAEHEHLAAETTGLVEEAARSAGIAPESLFRIVPEAPRRIGDSAYKEKPTQVLLQKVTVRQLVQLMHRLLSTDVGLRAHSIRLTAPRQETGGETWTAELVLTYLIYDPPRVENQGVRP